MTFISDSATLKEHCSRLQACEYIAIDTEFLRERTFYPILCVVQVASESVSFAVDMLAEDVDFEPLYALLYNPDILKVVHSGYQDLSILHHKMGKIPFPLFDTQIAAMVCGFGDSVSYAKLCQDLLNITLDKTVQYSDWSRRPLTPQQMVYALKDVEYLCQVYLRLKQQMLKLGRESWVQEEMLRIANPDFYILDPENAWRKLKPRSHDRRYLGLLQGLFKWREETARSLDKPRTHILKDQVLLDIANAHPASPEAFKNIPSVQSIRRSFIDPLFEIIKQVRDLPEDALPMPLELNEIDAGKEILVLNLLKTLLKVQSRKHNVAEKLIAGNDELKLLTLDDNARIPCLTGWRCDIFGNAALDLKHGKLALKANGENVEAVLV